MRMIIQWNATRTRRCGRLRSTMCRIAISLDWAEQRCAPSFVPIDFPDLTRVRLETCATGHTIIGGTSSGRAADSQSVEDVPIFDSCGGSTAGAGAAHDQQRSLRWWWSPPRHERALWTVRSRFAWPCAVKLDRQSLLLSTVDPPSITLGAGGSCRAPQKQWGACYAMLLFENVTFWPTQACTTPTWYSIAGDD